LRVSAICDLGEQTAGLADPPKQIVIRAWIRRIEPGWQHDDCCPSPIDGPLVRSPVDPNRPAGDDHNAVERRLTRKRIGKVERLFISPPSPDDRNGALNVGRLPDDAELRGRIRKIAQPRRIPRRGRSQQSRTPRKPTKHRPGIDQPATWLRGAPRGPALPRSDLVQLQRRARVSRNLKRSFEFAVR